MSYPGLCLGGADYLRRILISKLQNAAFGIVGLDFGKRHMLLRAYLVPFDTDFVAGYRDSNSLVDPIENIDIDHRVDTAAIKLGLKARGIDHIGRDFSPRKGTFFSAAGTPFRSSRRTLCA